MKISNVLIVVALAFSAAAHAQLNVHTTVQKEEVFVNEAGESETRLVAAEVVVPGETVYYTITFINTSDESADNVVITNPIENHRLYVDESAFGPGADMQFSVDGGTTFAVAKELTVTENGEPRSAESRDYTHIRWVMKNNLAAGAQGTARFAVVVE